MKQLIQQNPIATGALCLLALGIATNLGKLQQLQGHSAAIATQRQDIRNDQTQQQLINERLQRMAEVADARYKAGCKLVVAKVDPSKYASLVQGHGVTDYTTGQLLPDNTLVCDQNGNTAIITNGVADNFAFTGNQKLVQQRLEEYAASSTVPNVP